MAKKKTDKFDNEFDFGDDDDFNFDDFGALSPDSKPSKKRGVISDVFSGTISGIKSKFTDPEFIGQGVREFMPKSYDYFIENANDAAKNLSATYNDAVKELKPQVASIASNLNRVIPEHLTAVKKLSNKFDKFMNGEAVKTNTAESAENQLVGNTLSSVFGLQDKKADEERAADKADSQVKAIIDDKRFRSSTAILGRIADATSRATAMSETIGLGYMKKSLELQVRQLFTLQNLTDKSIKFQEISTRQYESIVKNTSLPEFVKLQDSERFKQLAKDKFFGSLQSSLMEMTGLGKMTSRIKKDAGSYVTGIKNGLTATNDGLEMIRDQIQQIEELNESGLNISKAELLGQMLGGGISIKARGLVTDAIKKALTKDAKIDKAGNKLSAVAMNTGAYAKRYKEKGDFQDKLYGDGISGKIYTALNYLLGTAQDEGGDFKLKDATSVSSMNAPGVITNKFIRSVEEVIPTWLAHIHRELLITRTGDTSAELSRFDFSKGVVISKADATKKVTDRLNKDADSIQYRGNVDKTYENFVGDSEVSPELEKEIKSFIMKVSREKNTVYDSEGISGSKHFSNLSGDAKAKVSELLKKYDTNDDSLEKSRKELELTTDMVSTRKGTTDIRASIEEMIKTYGVDVLLDAGIVKYDEANNLVIDEDKYYEIVEGGYYATSDKNKKKNIKAFGNGKSLFAKSDVNVKENIKDPKGSFLDKVRNTGVFEWMYKDGEGDANQHLGPMAQDVNKNMGESTAPGGKKIDLVNLNGINMAATQELANKVDNGLSVNSASVDYAKTSAETLTEILSTIKDKKFLSINLPKGFDIGKFDTKGLINKAKTGVKTAGGLAKDIAGRAINKASGTANWLNDVIFSPGLKYLNSDSTKKNITDTLGNVANNTIKLGSFLVNQMSKTVTERIPAVIKTIKKTAKSFLDTLYDGIIQTPDLYIKGKEEAVILINRLKAGDYYDSVTSKVLNTLKDIEECKGDILDKTGKIVVTAKEASEGFIDRFGKTVKRKAVNALQIGMAVGTKVIGAGLKAAKNVGSRMGKFLGLGDGRFDNFKDAMSDAFKDMNFGGMTNASNDAILDIRDILFKVHPKEALEIEKLKKSAKGNDEKRHKGIIASVKELFKSEKEKDKKEQSLQGDAVQTADGENNATATTTTETPSQDNPNPSGGKLKNLVSKAKKHFNIENEDGTIDKDKVKAKLTTAKDNILGSKMGQAAKGRFSKAGNLLSKIPGSGKISKLAKGAGGLVSKVGGGLLAGAGGILGSFMGGGGEEAGTEDTSDTSQAQDAKSYAAGKSAKSVNKTGIAAFNDKNADGRREGSFEDRLDDANKEKEERLKKKSLEKGEMKYRSKGNVIDKLMGMFANSFGAIASGATKLISGFLGKGGLLAKSLGWLKGGKLFTKLMGLGKILGIGGAIAAGGSVADSVGDVADAAGDAASLGSKAGKATTVADKAGKVAKASKFARVASLARGVLGLGSAASTVASVAGTASTVAGAATAGTAAAGTAATAAAGTAAATGGAAAGGGLLATAGAALLSPLGIGLLVVGAVVGGYMLYKYLTRNSVDDFEEVRMYQYGFGHTEDSKKHFGKLLALEAYLQDGRTGYTKTGPYIIQKKVNPEELYDFFKVDPKDPVKLNEFNDWFTNRFVPVYLYHVKTLYEIDNKVKLEKIKSLKPADILKYLESASYESAPYSVTASPVKEIPVINTDPTFAKNKVDEIRKKYVSKSKGTEKLSIKAPTDNNDEKLRAQRELGKIQEKAKSEVNASSTPKETRSPLSSTSKVESLSSSVSTGEDGPQAKLGDAKGINDAGTSINYSPTNIPAASGNLKDGSGGAAFMKFSSKNVSIATMNPEMKKRLLGMIQEYGELTGKSITVNSGTRTTEQQAALYKQNPGKAAKPGRSLHEFGVAVDINSVDVDTLDSMGLMRKYGFTRPVGGETWHVEPVGIQGRIGDIKKDSNLASSLIAQGEGYGGGGIGSIKGSKLGMRDPKGSSAVIAAGSKNVDNKQQNDASSTFPPKETVSDSTSSQSSSSTTIVKTGLAGAPSSFSGTTASGAPTAPADNIAKSIAEPEQKPASSPGAVPGTETTADSSGSATSGKTGGVEGAIIEGAKKTGMDPSMMKAFAAVESSMNPKASAKTSSAKGLYQFLDSTWNEQVQKNGRKYGFAPNADRFDPYTSTVIAGEYLKTNLKGISSVKKDTNIVDAYLTHFLGPGGARTFLSANPSDIAAAVMPKAAKANTGIFYNGGKPRTIGEVYSFLKDKIIAKAKSFGISLGSVGSLGSGNAAAASKGGELGIAGDSSGNGNIPASAKPNAGTTGAKPEQVEPQAKATPRTDPNSSQSPGFTRIDPIADNSSVNTSVSPARDNSASKDGVTQLVDVNKEQLQVFTAMFEFLKTELPKITGQSKSEASDTPKVQDSAAQPAATKPKGPTVDNTRPAKNELPPPSVSMGRRPFA